ncbi:DUF3488 and transglutaminase-like domain-containing protein [Pseudonocardia sp. RS11V-5]|uniref:transglutaminase domain-containing protein n=1 Tax=Pseudonocardia terrae TaxID=2905831 RepID=UPI001E5C624C|nr:transglutaminaseTgpA domain-containing protein [Pseudonocardia terrae]MCE3552384.1 DUF3488 and transglutaminase-like domain-containing protein [Pseudonocardia terrae]
MTSRVAGAGVVLTALVAGLSFSEVFAPTALVLPLLVVLVPVAVVDQLALRFTGLAPVRPLLGFVAGAAVGLTVLTLPGLPWEAAGRAVLDGALDGWLHTLESTFPARPEGPLLAFVPLLALLAAVIGVEWLRRGFAPLATLMPSAAVVILGQVFRAAEGWTAVLLAVGYGVAAAVALAAGRQSPGKGFNARRLVDVTALVLPVLLVAGLGAWGLAAADPLGLPTYSVHDRFQLTQVPAGTVSPLTEIGGRLDAPETVVFTARTEAPVDRWPQLVLDGYDGAGWTSSATYRPLGAALHADPAVTVGTQAFDADITLGAGADGPWLPSQNRTVSVDGLSPAVDAVTGTLLDPDRGGVADYHLRWSAAQPALEQLVGAAIDRGAPGSVQVADLPAGIATATTAAIGQDPPSFATAQKLEKWLKDNHTVATGDELPTGSGNAQLLDFLNRSKRGTSEQFAAAYVLMARQAGIPARLVVGFRSPKSDGSGTYVVRNADAFAWPEVAVAGVGWVPLDPTGGARENPDKAPPVTQAADASAENPQQPTQAVPQQSSGPGQAAPAPAMGEDDRPLWVVPVVIVGALVLAWLAGVPAAKWFRRLRRRRAPGAEGVVGAWLDTRDRLRDHGVPTTTGMTVRDVVEPGRAVLNGSSGELERLARCVDEALWSGEAVRPELADEAWAAARTVRQALHHRPVGERLRAALGLRGLRGTRSPKEKTTVRSS